MSRAILEGPESEEVLRLVARRARELINADVAIIAMPRADEPTISVRVVEGAHASDLRGTPVLEGSMSAEVMQT